MISFPPRSRRFWGLQEDALEPETTGSDHTVMTVLKPTVSADAHSLGEPMDLEDGFKNFLVVTRLPTAEADALTHIPFLGIPCVVGTARRDVSEQVG